MTRPAPFDGTLLRVSADAMPLIRRMFVVLKMEGVLPPSARMVRYRGGYVALRLTVAQTHVLVMACGLTLPLFARAASGED